MNRVLFALILCFAALSAAAQPYVHLAPARVETAGAVSTEALTAAGWRVTDWLAAEVSRVASGPTAGGKLTATGASAVLMPRIAGGLRGVVKIGAHRLKATSSGGGVVFGAGAPAADVDIGTRAGFGLGLDYELHRNLRLRATAETIDGAKGFDDLRVFAIGVVAQF